MGLFLRDDMPGNPETDPNEICRWSVRKSGSGFLIGLGGAVAACMAAKGCKKKSTKSVWITLCIFDLVVQNEFFFIVYKLYICNIFLRCVRW